jgi:hypothetical protein
MRWVLVIAGKCEVDSRFRGLLAGGRVTSMPTVVMPLTDGFARRIARLKGRREGTVGSMFEGSHITSWGVRTMPASGARDRVMCNKVSHIW